MAPNKKPCIYCDVLTLKGKKGEHIIQEAIGGALTLLDVQEQRFVCTTCNNGVLGEIDKEFTSKSYLSIVASQEIGAYLAQVWNIDHSAEDLLIEAEPKWIDGELADLRCYPQLTFEKSGPHIRGDAAEMKAFGNDNYYRVLIKAAKSAFQRYIAGNKALHFERVEAGVIEEYRLAPRLFTRKPIVEIAEDIDKASFTLRFANGADKRFALKSLDGLSETQLFNNRKLVAGSFTPRISFTFNVGHTIRGLVKIAINLVAAFCPNTPVNPRTFEAAIQLIRGNVQISPLLINTNGFVCAEGIQQIKAEDMGHSFRLIWVDGLWHVYSSFFGGRVGAYVHFPGPNEESWCTAEIVAPLHSKKWTISKSPLILPLANVKVEWNESSKLCPSLKIQDSKSVFRVELIKVKPKKA